MEGLTRMDILVFTALVVGLYMAWSIGSNDAANSMADAVGSKALTICWAVILAGICEFAGAVLVGSNVTNTIRKGIIDTQFFANNPDLLAKGMVCALLAAAIWLSSASYFGMPVSTTHSIVGALLGFGLLQAGFAQIQWGTIGQIIASWFISPLAGGMLAFVIFKLISKHILSADKPALAAQKGVPVCVFITMTTVAIATIYKGLNHLNLNLNAAKALAISSLSGLLAAGISGLMLRKSKKCNGELPLEEQLQQVEKNFAILVIITSCTVAFAHGANDVANAIGPLAAVVEISKYHTTPEKVPVEMWILALGGIGIVLGLATFGYRVMKLVGTKVTEITPSRGVAADLGAMVTVLVCSKLGLPISTTHTLVGAILGVGLARGITAINKKIVGSILASWLITVPIAAGLTILIYLLGQWFIWE